MDGKIILSTVFVFLIAFQTGCQIVRDRLEDARPVNQIAQSSSSNNVVVSGIVKEVKSISVPENGMTLAQVIAHVTVDRPKFELVKNDDQDEEDELDTEEDFDPLLWVSIRKNATIQRKMIFVPYSFVRFGSAGDINIAVSYTHLTLPTKA